VEDALGLDHDAYALFIFAIPILVAALIETPLALASDRLERRRLLGLALGALGSGLLLAALARHPWSLSLSLALAGAASGVATIAAEAELITRHPGRAELAMSRWAAFAAAGDVLAPLLCGIVMAAGGSFRTALVALAALLSAHAVALLARGARAQPATTARDLASEPIRPRFRDTRLWVLLCGAAFCTLLDEIVVALAALRLARDLGAGPAMITLALVGYSLGSLLGAAATEKLLATRSARTLLSVSAASSLLALGLLASASSPVGVLGALMLLGTSAAPHHPLLQAAAYDRVPGRPGLVNAIGQVFVVLEIALPLAVGAIAARFGLSVALAALAAQPAIVIAVSLAVLGRKKL
jgi:MFS family permease